MAIYKQKGSRSVVCEKETHQNKAGDCAGAAIASEARLREDEGRAHVVRKPASIFSQPQCEAKRIRH